MPTKHPGTRRLPPAVDLVRRLPRRLGFDLGRPGRGPSPWAPAQLQVPAPYLAAVKADTTFILPTSRLMNIHGYSAEPGGFFPLAATVRSLAAEPGLTYAQSPLAHVHRLIQPKTAMEAMLNPGDLPMEALATLPAAYLPEIWILSPKDLRTSLDRSRRPDRSAHMGPVSDELGERELQALRSLATSIAKDGYQADRARTIEGYFIAADDERWRFVLTDGQHRLAVLIAMGTTEVRVRVWNGPAAVHLDHLDRWIRPRGIYSRDTAERLVELLLDRKGNQRMESRGGDLDVIAPHGRGTVDEAPVTFNPTARFPPTTP